MQKHLYETKSKAPLVDEANHVINETIDHFLDDDIFYKIAPFLSIKKEIGKDTDYFSTNRITLTDKLNGRERKTASYLAPFFKIKSSHNPKEVYRYLLFNGHDVAYEDIEILTIRRDASLTAPIDMSSCETFTDYLEFIEIEVSLRVKVINHFDIISKNLNGFDKYFDRITFN